MARSTATTLAVWNDHLVQLGSEVLEARLALVSELRAPVAKAYADLAPTGGDAGLDYKASWCEGSPLDQLTSREEIAAELRQALERVERDELQRGVTLVGPHRDDLRAAARRPSGQGLRLARGVVVDGAGTPSRLVRAAARRR